MAGLLPLAGTPGERFLAWRALRGADLTALKYQAGPPQMVVAPLSGPSGVPNGALVTEINAADTGWKYASRMIGGEPGSVVRLRPLHGDVLALALSLEDGLAYTALRDLPVWVSPMSPRWLEAVEVPAGLSRLILVTPRPLHGGERPMGMSRHADEFSRRAKGFAKAQAAAGVTTTIETPVSRVWSSDCSPKHRARTVARWADEERTGQPASTTFRPDGMVWTFRRGWRPTQG